MALAPDLCSHERGILQEHFLLSQWVIQVGFSDPGLGETMRTSPTGLALTIPGLYSGCTHPLGKQV